MSHLLSRLVDRALGTAPSIEPMRAPVFMDTSPGSSGYGEIAGHETPGFVYGDLVTSMQAPLSQTADARVGLTDGDARQEEPECVPTEIVQPLLKDALIIPNKDVSPIPTVNSQQQQEQEVVASSSPLDSQSVRTASKIVEPEPRDTGLSPLNSQTLQTINDQPVRHAITRHLNAYPLTREQGNEPEPGPVAVSTQHQLRPRVSLPPQPGAIDNQFRERINHQAAQPTIQVTIGRIDVRAVATPPPPAPRTRKKLQPTLSLDDYLKQRTGGKR